MQSAQAANGCKLESSIERRAEDFSRGKQVAVQNTKAPTIVRALIRTVLISTAAISSFQRSRQLAGGRNTTRSQDQRLSAGCDC